MRKEGWWEHEAQPVSGTGSVQGSFGRRVRLAPRHTGIVAAVKTTAWLQTRVTCSRPKASLTYQAAGQTIVDLHDELVSLSSVMDNLFEDPHTSSLLKSWRV